MVLGFLGDVDIVLNWLQVNEDEVLLFDVLWLFLVSVVFVFIFQRFLGGGMSFFNSFIFFMFYYELL